MNIKRGKTSQAPDMQIRREALDRRRSFILEAPAGSGKTALLTARFLALLAEVRHPRQILAVTFTRKAAAEMADRITRTLWQAQAGADHAPGDAWETHLLELARSALKAHPDWDILLRSPDAFLVDTFHGFCARIARNWPLEARTPPMFALLDEIGQMSLLDEAVEQYLHALSAGEKRMAPAEIAAFQRRLAEANNSVRAVAGQLFDILARRDRLESLIRIFRQPSAEDELARRTEQLAGLYLGNLNDYFRRHKEAWSALRQALDQVRPPKAATINCSRPRRGRSGVSDPGYNIEIPIHEHKPPKEATVSCSRGACPSSARGDAVAAGRIHALTCPQCYAQRCRRAGAATGTTISADIPGITLRDVPAWASAAEVFLVKAGSPRKQFKTGEFGQKFSETPQADFIRNLPPAIAQSLHFIRNWPDTSDPVGFDALCDFLRLAQGVLQQFDNLLATRGLDFMELELAALRAFDQVARPSESLIFFHEHLRHILVDEAQDMNDTQERILSALTEGWEPGDGRSVFIVGDPKQSIFRFRRAEVSLFESLKAQGLRRPGEAALPLSTLSLSANFRSRPYLVAFANKVFDQVMAAPCPAFDEVEFKASEPVRDALTPGTPVTIGLFYYRRSHNQQAPEPPKAEARDQEARYVAEQVAALYADKPAESIAILIPVRTHLTPYIRALQTLAIPVRLMEGVPMLDCPEVRHLLNLFKALLRPHDDVAWAGALRAPWCYVPAATLEKLAALPLSGKRWSEKIAMADRSLHPELIRFNSALDKVRPDFGREPYAVSLQRLWEELGGPAAVARLGGAAGVANCRHCLEALAKSPTGCSEETFSTLQRALEHAYTPPDPRAAFSSVAIMTIHKAKGLEFDHVFVVGLDREALGHAARGAPDTAFLMDRLPPGSAKLRQATPERFPPMADPPLVDAQAREREFLAATAGDRRTRAQPLAHFLLSNLGLKRDAAEYKRLFYVAATRARETLTLSGLIPQSVGNSERPSAIAWLATMGHEGMFEGLQVEVLKNPVAPGKRRGVSAPVEPLPSAAPFEPDPLPYLIQSPSKIEDATATTVRSGAEEADPDARARGIVIHRILETLARGALAPEVPAVATALAVEGITAEGRLEKAQEILAECRRAWEFEAFAALRNAATEILPEWALEDWTDNKIIRIGRIDLVLKTAKGIVLVDYKTGRAAQDTEEWLAAELARYRPQLGAYREMAAKVLGASSSCIQAALFFTPLLRWVEVK
ncbi:MAG: UvrD-helicase domain-containing protein [Lentisphaerae bacterium]|nr:UvrD-helicase domain-containing protein [Lentisphaerota bacterium]